jgi:hypothetical protein
MLIIHSHNRCFSQNPVGLVTSSTIQPKNGHTNEGPGKPFDADPFAADLYLYISDASQTPTATKGMTSMDSHEGKKVPDNILLEFSKKKSLNQQVSGPSGRMNCRTCNCIFETAKFL